MNKAIQVLIVDNDCAGNKQKEVTIKQSGLSNEVKIAMNGGHAMLYLDHIHLNQKINNYRLLILLNIHTPITDGFHFLYSYKNSSLLKKENIHIVVIDENLTNESVEKIKNFGVSDFISNPMCTDTLHNIVNTKFRYNLEIEGSRQETSKDTPLVAARGK